MFYAVQIIMNGRANTMPSKFDSKIDAINYAKKVKSWSDGDVEIEARIYEVFEINY